MVDQKKAYISGIIAVLLWSTVASAFKLTLRYLTEIKKRRITQDELSRRILEDFDQEKHVHFAYTTYRIVR